MSGPCETCGVDPAVVDEFRQSVDGLRRGVDSLREEVGSLRTENKSLRRENAKLQDKVRELEARLGLNSQNSSIPPSADPLAAPKRPRKKRTGRKPGGQPGHQRYERPLVPEDQVDYLIPVVPDSCDGCEGKLHGVDKNPLRHQVIDLPERIEAEVTEHQLHRLSCGDCGTVTTAALPDGVPRGRFGPRLIALIAVFAGVYRLSHRLIVQALTDIFDIEISLGSITACQRLASRSVAAPVEEAREYVKAQAVKLADETSWFQGASRSKVWMWVVHTLQVSVFMIHVSRGAVAAREILGEAFGYLVTDRWKAYDWWPILYRQFCWAHLKRQFQGFIDAGGGSTKIGDGLIEQTELLFKYWYRVRDGTLKRSSFQVYVSTIRQDVEAILERGTRCRNKQTAGRCRTILKDFSALWTFARVEGIEPTNNGSERTIRHGVIWRKLSFGTHSIEGSRFVERMLTVSATLKQQKRRVFSYLTNNVTAYFNNAPPESLLPAAAE